MPRMHLPNHWLLLVIKKYFSALCNRLISMRAGEQADSSSDDWRPHQEQEQEISMRSLYFFRKLEHFGWRWILHIFVVEYFPSWELLYKMSFDLQLRFWVSKLSIHVSALESPLQPSSVFLVSSCTSISKKFM